MHFKQMTRAAFLCASAAAGPSYADGEVNVFYTPKPLATFLPTPDELATPPPQAEITSSPFCDIIGQNSLTGEIFEIQRPEETLFIMQPRIMGFDETTWTIRADLSDPETTPHLQVMWKNGVTSEIIPESEEFIEQEHSILFSLSSANNAALGQSIEYIPFEEYERAEDVCYLEAFDGEIQVGCKLPSGHFSSFTITEEFISLAGTYNIPIEDGVHPYQTCIYEHETPETGQSYRFVLP